MVENDIYGMKEPDKHTATYVSIRQNTSEYVIMNRDLLGGRSLHSDRVCEGRNGTSKLVSD